MAVSTTPTRTDHPARTPAPGRTRPVRQRDTRAAIVFLSPNLVLVVGLTFVPTVASIVLAFTQWDVITPPELIGWENFRELAGDPSFRRAMLNTLVYTVISVPITIGFGLVLALALQRTAYLRRLYRLGFFAPVVLSSVLVGLTWRWFFDPYYGLANYLLDLVGLTGPNWLADPTLALPSIIFMATWQNIGLYLVFFLVALEEVPQELRWAARVDGCGPWQEFRHVTFPMISPMTFFAFLIAAINAFQVFDLVYVTAGNAEATLVMIQFIYDEAFLSFRMGYAAAASILYLIIIATLTLVFWSVRRRWVVGE